MGRSLIWLQETEGTGWACSNCAWRYPVPTFLADPEAKAAYDRLATSTFRSHICQKPSTAGRPLEETGEPSVSDRIRKLIKAGYKPKDAVSIALDELSLEHRADAYIMSKARTEAEEFLRKLKEGLI